LYCFNSFVWWKFIFLFFGHFMMDTVKVKESKICGKPCFDLFDQCMHIFQCIIVYAF
jgi:hypothetical protein